MACLAANSLLHRRLSSNLGPRMGGKSVPGGTYSINSRIPAGQSHDLSEPKRQRQGNETSMRIPLNQIEIPASFRLGIRSLSAIGSALIGGGLAHICRFFVDGRLEVLGRSFFRVLN